MERKVALITGITGQDGSYLPRIAHLEGAPHFHLHYADLSDSMSVLGVVGKVKPTEIYNLAAQSHVQVSFDSPEYTADVDAVGVLRILEAVRQLGLTDSCRIYQASTSELAAASIRLPHPNSMARWKRYRRTRTRLSIPTLPMLWPSSMASGS